MGSNRTTSVKRLAIIIILWICNTHLFSQNLIYGTIVAQDDKSVLPYANVALFDSLRTTLIGGSNTNLDGEFEIKYKGIGNSFLRISAVGFETMSLPVDLSLQNINIGVVALATQLVNLKDVVVQGDRLKSEYDGEKNIYLINRNMLNASSSGTDILKLLPGIHVDLMHNVSLEGSQNILILVNGRERDRQFVSQLQASQVDKVEVINNPSAKYDAGISGVINIILHKEQNKGMDAYINLEAPTSSREIYAMPNYGFNYNVGKFNFSTSYSGELAYFDIKQSYNRWFTGEGAINKIISDQNVRQKSWSNRFNFTVDYLMNEKNQFNFYAYLNPHSHELDGFINLDQKGAQENLWKYEKEEEDMNLGRFNSVYYKRLFKKPGHELWIDLSNYSLTAKNSTVLNVEDPLETIQNSKSHSLNLLYGKIDYLLPLGDKVKLNAGIHHKRQNIKNNQELFAYDDRYWAYFGTLNFNLSKMEINFGARYERLESGIHKNAYTVNRIFPNGGANFKISAMQNLKFSYRSWATFPLSYHLNPHETIIDPFTFNFGNPNLQISFRNNFNLEHSIRLDNHSISSSFFYNKITDAIEDFSRLNGNVLETAPHNLSNISQYGMQFSGVLSIGKWMGINPYFRIFNIETLPCLWAKEIGLIDRRKLAYDLNISAFATPISDLTLSFLYKYSSAINHSQGKYYSGALYFISLEKTFNNFKVGVVTAVPFAKTFTYQGSTIELPGLHQQSEGNIQLSSFPLFLKIGYKIKSGQNRVTINREKQEVEKLERKSF